MHCHTCSVRCRPFGRNRSSTRRYRCRTCGRTFSEPRHTIGNRYTSFEDTALIATLLVEGTSILSTARIVGMEDKTVASLLAEIGNGCGTLLRNRVGNVDISPSGG